MWFQTTCRNVTNVSNPGSGALLNLILYGMSTIKMRIIILYSPFQNFAIKSLNIGILKLSGRLHWLTTLCLHQQILLKIITHHIIHPRSIKLKHSWIIWSTTLTTSICLHKQILLEIIIPTIHPRSIKLKHSWTIWTTALLTSICSH